jgi:hypothetical protein
MRGRPFGIVLLAAALLATGLAGFAAFWGAWPSNAGTSPLSAIFALVWGCTYTAASVLIWKRSLLAPPTFLAAIGLLMVLLWFIFPTAHHIVRPGLVIILVLAFLGSLALQRASVPVV